MSDDFFEVGDLVILQHATYFHEYDGTPAIIVEGRSGRLVTNLNTMEEIWLPVSYDVHILCVDDLIATVAPHQIRRPWSHAQESSMAHSYQHGTAKGCQKMARQIAVEQKFECHAPRLI